VSPWAERPSEGPRSKGQMIKFRWVIVAQTACWALALEHADAQPIGKKFAANFHDLICNCKTEADLDPEECLKAIRISLEKMTGKKFKANGSDLPAGAAGWMAAARQLDDFFQTNYALESHEPVRSRLFGVSEDEDGEE
jgi:hypothetical protein